MKRIINLTINDEAYEIAAKPGATLLDVLREEIGLTGTKRGCNMGDCGACTVLIDGKPMNACLVLAADAQGRRIQTIEGLAAGGGLHPLQRAFVERGAIQCGFCTPGMIMTAKALIDENPDPTEEDVKQALSGNLCRCTGYTKIVDAVLHWKEYAGEEGGAREKARMEDGNLGCILEGPIAREGAEGLKHDEASAKTGLRGNAPADESTGLSVVGKRLPRADAPDKATGRAVYTDDIKLPNMLYGKILLSPVAHARIRSINTRKAEKLPGVKAVLTGKDVPDIKYGVSPPRYDENVLAKEKVLYAGDLVAAVAAVDEETCIRALDLIEVDYEELPAVFDPFEAMADGAPRLHEDRFEKNINTRVDHHFGDVEKGFEEADYVREETFAGNRTYQHPMEPQCAIAEWDRHGRVTVYTSTQVVHYVHHMLSHILQIPLGDIRVVMTNCGGGFGAKAATNPLEILSILLAKKTGRPVKMRFTREEMTLYCRGRHKQSIKLKIGVKKDGRITAVKQEAVLEGGAYSSFGIVSAYYAGSMLPTLYKIPNYKYDGYRVNTNLPSCGAMRGHGCPHPRFAFESLLTMIAEDIGMDPIEIRLVNAMEPNTRTCNDLDITSCEFKKCLELVKEKSGWYEKKGKLPPGRGIGIGCGGFVSGAGYPIYRSQFPHSNAVIKVVEDGTMATLFTGEADIGQGSDTVLAQMAAEAMGLTYDRVKVVSADSDVTPLGFGAYSSRVTLMGGNACRMAGEEVKKQVLESASEILGVPVEDLDARENRVYSKRDPSIAIEWELAAARRFGTHGPVVGKGHYAPPKGLGGKFKGAAVGTSPAYSFSATVCEVEVDMETGKVKVLNFWDAHDCGTAINPMAVEGQAEGAVFMGMSETLFENMVFDEKGVLKNPNLHDYLIGTSADMPHIESNIVESYEPRGPYGAKEVGEGATLPVLGAVANAVADAIGVHITSLPITPEKILRAIREKSSR